MSCPRLERRLYLNSQLRGEKVLINELSRVINHLLKPNPRGNRTDQAVIDQRRRFAHESPDRWEEFYWFSLCLETCWNICANICRSIPFHDPFCHRFVWKRHRALGLSLMELQERNESLAVNIKSTAQTANSSTLVSPVSSGFSRWTSSAFGCFIIHFVSGNFS